MQYKHLGLGYSEQCLLVEAVFGKTRTEINELIMNEQLTMGELAIIPGLLNFLSEAIRNYYGDSVGAEREKKMRAIAESIGVGLATEFEWDMFTQYAVRKAREVRKNELQRAL